MNGSWGGSCVLHLVGFAARASPSVALAPYHAYVGVLLQHPPSFYEFLVPSQQSLRSAGERHLHGFMRTGAVIRAEGSGKVLGIVIEQMSGETIDKHLLAARTAALDVLFIRAMLRQVGHRAFHSTCSALGKQPDLVFNYCCHMAYFLHAAICVLTGRLHPLVACFATHSSNFLLRTCRSSQLLQAHKKP